MSILSTSDGSLKSKVSAGATGESVVAVSSATSMVYVSSGTLNGTVTVIDGNKDQMVAQIPVGETPVGIAIDETADRIYVADQHSATISVIDGASNQVIATWQPREGNVWKLAVDPALNRLYASIPPLNLLSFTGVEMLDNATGAFVTEVAAGSSAAEDVAVNPRTHHLFLTDQNNGTVAVIDGATNTVLQSLATGTSAYALAVDANSGLVYVSNPFDATIGVFADRPSGSSPPVVDSGGIVSAASGSAALSAGAIVTAYRAGLASGTVIADGIPWPTTLGGVSVLVNGISAPIYFVSPGQIAFQPPGNCWDRREPPSSLW